MRVLSETVPLDDEGRLVLRGRLRDGFAILWDVARNDMAWNVSHLSLKTNKKGKKYALLLTKDDLWLRLLTIELV